jgi:hypothetical protein
MTQDGRSATRPYRVRAGGVWYWVDPSVPARDIEPGDTVVLYPVSGEPAVAVLQSRPDANAPFRFSAGDESFEVDGRDIATLHLAAVDDVQA